MAKPSEKAPAIEAFIDSMNPFGRKRRECIENEICTWCGAKVDYPDEFRDEIGVKEYSISGMCQQCQDRPHALIGI